MVFACRTECVNVVQDLLDNHQDKFSDWIVDQLRDAVLQLRGNVPQQPVSDTESYAAVAGYSADVSVAGCCCSNKDYRTRTE